MKEIHVALYGRDITVSNYDYSPYFKALKDSSTSDKILIDDVECYTIDELLNIADNRLILHYIYYIQHGYPQINNYDQLLKMIKLMEYMGHNMVDIKLLCDTTSDQPSAQLHKVLRQNDGISIGVIESITDNTITVTNDIDIKKKDRNFKIEHGNLYYKTNGKNRINLGYASVNGSRLRARTVLNVTKVNNMYCIDDNILYPSDGILYYISYSSDLTSSHLVRSYDINGDNLSINGGEIDLIKIVQDCYVDSNDQLWKFNASTNGSTMITKYESLIQLPPNYYRNYILEYVKTILSDTWTRDMMYELELYKMPFYGCTKRSINYYTNDHIEQIDKLFSGVQYAIAGGYVDYLISNKRHHYSADIDVFLCGDNCELAIDKIIKSGVKYHITGNAITIVGYIDLPIQVILRRYKAPTEIIHGFDVDSSCSMWYDGKIYNTKRYELAHKYMINMFNTARMSETYVLRLLKYKMRGYKILLPDLRLLRQLRDNIILKLCDYVNSKAMVKLYNSSTIEPTNKYYDLMKVVRYKLRNNGVDDVDLHLFKIKLAMTYNLIEMKKIDYASQIVFLLDDMKTYTTNKYRSDYAKGEKKAIDEIEWKEQDPMTQVTSTFNPIVYDNFIHLLDSSGLLS